MHDTWLFTIPSSNLFYRDAALQNIGGNQHANLTDTLALFPPDSAQGSEHASPASSLLFSPHETFGSRSHREHSAGIGGVATASAADAHSLKCAAVEVARAIQSARDHEASMDWGNALQEYEKAVILSDQIAKGSAGTDADVNLLRDSDGGAAAAAENTLIALHGAMSCLQRLGYLKDALGLLPKLKEASLEVYGSYNHPAFAAYLNADANLDRMMGSFDSSIAKFKIALRLLKMHHVTGKDAVSITLNLGQVYTELSLTEKASQCFEWCLRTCHRMSTADETGILLQSRAQCNMGDLKRMRGDVDGARRCYSFAVESVEATFGSDSFHLIDPVLLCAAAYAELGDGDAALHRLQAALSIAERLYVFASNCERSDSIDCHLLLLSFPLVFLSGCHCGRRYNASGAIRPLVTVLNRASILYAQAGMLSLLW